jgi:hypothetical protein
VVSLIPLMYLSKFNFSIMQLEDGYKHILLLEQSPGLLLSVYVNYLLHDSFASADQKASNQMTVVKPCRTLNFLSSALHI